MPFLIAAGSSLVPAAFKMFTSRRQAKQSRLLKQTDVTPESQRQNMAAARLAVASGRMPGQDVAENQIDQTTAATLNAVRQGATGGSSVLAALGRTNGQRLGALSGLSTRTQAYQDAAKQRLAGVTQVQAGYDNKSRDEYTNAKTALDQASSENAMGALSDVANTGAFAAGQMLSPAGGTTASGGVVGNSTDSTLPSAYPGQTLFQRLQNRRNFRRGPISSYNTVGTRPSNLA
jgi:hypothetical protein